jgi:hypothetical protein
VLTTTLRHSFAPVRVAPSVRWSGAIFDSEAKSATMAKGLSCRRQ